MFYLLDSAKIIKNQMYNILFQHDPALEVFSVRTGDKHGNRTIT